MKTILFCLLVATIAATSSASKANCLFRDATWEDIGTVYTCFTRSVEDSPADDPAPDNLTVNEEDLPEGKTLADVGAFYANNIQWPRGIFPRNLGRVLPNLKAIEFNGCGFSNITSSSFFGLEFLVHISLQRNDFVSLQGRLFRHVKKLKKVKFGGCRKLKNIGFNLFRGLLDLKELDFEGAECGGGFTLGRTWSQIASELFRSCPPDPDDMEEDMENMECEFREESSKSKSSSKGN